MESNHHQVIVVGTGLGSLTAASLLAKKGFDILVLEKNWIPGGCTSSYPRKHFIFESGATTLVGLDEGMPLHILEQRLGIKFSAVKLDVPMKIILSDGTLLTRYADNQQWINESSRVFGPTGQELFWNTCKSISDWVWSSSSRFLRFPPERISDWVSLISNTKISDVRFLKYAFMSVKDFMNECGIKNHDLFEKFINEQLIITAQNTCDDVNMLFGATALCYTQQGNYYPMGGMMELPQRLTSYIEELGGIIKYREGVEQIEKKQKTYHVSTSKDTYTSDYIISGIPINNLQSLIPSIPKRKSIQVLSPDQLYSAFQMGIVVKGIKIKQCLHWQIHTPDLQNITGSNSIFLSSSHPDDSKRSVDGHQVLSVSTHIHHPHNKINIPKGEIESLVLQILENHQLIDKNDIVYLHSSLQSSWEKWTGRMYGFVGGYPQQLSIKPWKINAARIDGKGLYGTGDTFYPGQGIPGVCLSGLIAAEKLMADHL
jgi:C-3',4' desaturase CrtD